MFLASGDFSTGEELFKQIKEPNVQNYVMLMNYFNTKENWQQTIELYEQMKQQRKIQADVSTYLNVLAAVKQLKNLDKAKEIQNEILKQNLWQNHEDIKNILNEIFQLGN